MKSNSCAGSEVHRSFPTMTGPAPLSEHQCLGLGSRALHQLRASLERDGGIQAATTLQEAGVAGGEGLFSAFAGWLQTAYGVVQPGDLDATYLPDALRGFFSDFGWGNIAISDLSPAVMALDSEDWAEASPDQGSQYPSCHLTSGLLADFLGRLGQGSVAVMEVECRTRGDARCRFLVGAPESLSALYDRMARGLTYLEALGLPAGAA
jgi:predicted hydrocarbon binding protein